MSQTRRPAVPQLGPRILAHLRQGPPQSIAEIAEALRLTQHGDAIASQLRTLARKGQVCQVEQVHGPAGHRVWLWGLVEGAGPSCLAPIQRQVLLLSLLLPRYAEAGSVPGAGAALPGLKQAGLVRRLSSGRGLALGPGWQLTPAGQEAAHRELLRCLPQAASDKTRALARREDRP